MSNDGKKGMLKFITFGKTVNKEREYIDTSTERSRTQHRQPRHTNTDFTSNSPSPSTKRKRRLTDIDRGIQPAKSICKLTSKDMRVDLLEDNMELQNLRKKLSPELEDLRSEIEQMICPLKDGLNLLLEMRSSWEAGLQKCNTLLTENKQLHARVDKVEKENKTLNTEFEHLKINS